MCAFSTDCGKKSENKYYVSPIPVPTCYKENLGPLKQRKKNNKNTMNVSLCLEWQAWKLPKKPTNLEKESGLWQGLIQEEVG